MVDTQIEKLEQKLLRNMSYFLTDTVQERRSMQAILKSISKNQWPTFLFGGVPRDLLYYGVQARVRDIDLVVDGVSSQEMQFALKPYIKRLTRFGGLNLETKGWLVDVWPLKETWAFRQDLVPMAGFTELPRTTFMNIEAIAVELSTVPGRKRNVYSHGFFEGILNQTVDINLRDNPFPALCITRALRSAECLGFAISPQLVEYIVFESAKLELEELLVVQNHHYGRILLGSEKLHTWLKILRDHLRTKHGEAIVLPRIRSEQLELSNEWDMNRNTKEDVNLLLSCSLCNLKKRRSLERSRHNQLELPELD